MNERYAKLLKLMADYDLAKVGSPERAELGNQLEREGSKKVQTERDFWNVVEEYKKFIELENQILVMKLEMEK